MRVGKVEEQEEMVVVVEEGMEEVQDRDKEMGKRSSRTSR
jgi:hypothetical protein